jgi:outer membrane protein TolC
VTFVAADTPPEELIEKALANHPDVRAAARRVKAADIDDDASHLGPFVPLVRAGLGGPPYGGGLGYDGPRFTSLHDREDYYLGVELHLDGLGFGEIARARAAGARLRGEKVREDDVRDQVARLVLESSAVVRSRRAAIDAALEELEAATAARAIAEKRLEQGVGLALDVIAADDERTRAATHVVDAITGYNAAQYELVVRLGEAPR